MKKEDLLSDDFLKQFKTGEDINGFLAQLQKRCLEAILNGELDAHFGYIDWNNNRKVLFYCLFFYKIIYEFIFC